MHGRGNAQGYLAGIRFIRGASFLFAIGKVMIHSIVKIFDEPVDRFTFKGDAVLYPDHLLN